MTTPRASVPAIMPPPPIDSPLPESVDRRKLRKSFEGERPRAFEVYHAALRGWSGQEIRKAFFPAMLKGTFSKQYRHLVNEAQIANPNAADRVRAKVTHGTDGAEFIAIDEAEVRRLARTTAPDKIIAISLKVSVDALRGRFRDIIDEERANLGIELATGFVTAARGRPAKLSEDGKTVLESEIRPNLELGEKLLNRIGFMEAPIESELKVVVRFDEGPKKKEKPTGKSGALLDLGDDD